MRDGTYIGFSIEYDVPGQQEIHIRGKVWLDTEPVHPHVVVELCAPDCELVSRFRGLVCEDEG
jgi:hypothetical protein